MKKNVPELKHAVNKDLFNFISQFINCGHKKNGKCDGCIMEVDFIIMAAATEIFNDKEFKKLAKSNSIQADKLKKKWL